MAVSQTSGGKTLRTIRTYSAPIYRKSGGLEGCRPFNLVAETADEALAKASKELKDGEYLKEVKPFGPKYTVFENNKILRVSE